MKTWLNIAIEQRNGSHLQKLEKVSFSTFFYTFVVVNYSENDRIKAIMKETHESNCIHKIRTTVCSEVCTVS